MRLNQTLDPLPLDCRHVWGWFFDLLQTRQVGMADNPITYTEIDAYCRRTDAVMRPWEAKAIVSVYWAYRNGVPKSGGKGAVQNVTEASDGAGVGAMLKSMSAPSKTKPQ